MKIAVIGIGGVGGYYGGLLARHYFDNKDVEISFVARGRHLDEIKANGLKVFSEEVEFTVRPDLATDDPSGCGIFDLALFCVKGYDLEESAEILAPNINENTVIISLLNGVDNAEKLKSVFNDGVVLNGCVYISSHIIRPGVVKQAGGSCKLFFGGGSKSQIDGAGIEPIFKRANIEAAYKKDIKNIVWEKYIFISPFASATTYLGKTIRELLNDATGKTLLEDLLEEVLSVADAQGIQFQQNIRELTIEKAYAFPFETKTSMQMDFEKGKKAELETFTGFIVKASEKQGLAVPVHEKVYAALKKRLAN
jgi:2-dehydropantoate 2-reductase